MGFASANVICLQVSFDDLQEIHSFSSSIGFCKQLVSLLSLVMSVRSDVLIYLFLLIYKWHRLQLVSSAIQRCRLSGELCRLSVVVKCSPPSDPFLIRISSKFLPLSPVILFCFVFLLNMIVVFLFIFWSFGSVASIPVLAGNACD